MIKKEELERVWEVFSLEKKQIGINPFNADKECVMYERFEEFYSNFSSCLEEKNVYFRLNPVRDLDYQKWSKEWTCGKDISHREWILVDLDGDCHKEGEDKEGISQLEKLSQQVIQFLEKEGFSSPVIGFSGNGYHLLYKYDSILGDCDVKDFLYSLHEIFPQVDTSVSDLNRFTRFYGTVNQKGKRLSQVVSLPQEITTINSSHISSYLKKYPAPTTMTTTTTNKKEKKTSRFEKVRWTKEDDVFRDKFFSVYKSIPQFLKEYDLYLKTEDYQNDGYKHILNCCPYQEHEKEKECDAVIFDNFKQVRHTIRFSCFHTTCDVDKEGNDLPGTKRFSDFVRYIVGDEEFERLFGENLSPLVEEENPKFITNLKIRRKPKQEFFSTGYQNLDTNLGGGLSQRQLTIISGKAGSGKSTFLNNIIWNTSVSDVKSVYFTEQHPDDVCTNLAKTYFSQPSVSEQEREKALTELENKVVFYNKENYSCDWREVLEDIKEFFSSHTDFKILWLDNLSLLCPYNSENTKEQQELALSLVQLAEEKNINVSLVVHPSKNGEKVCGTSLFENLASQVLEVENISTNKN